MKYEFTGGSSFPVLRFALEAGESIKAESGAMVAMSDSLHLTGKADGGILRGIARKFSGESFFMQHVEAKDGAGWVMLAAAMPGGIAPVEMTQGRMLMVQKNGFLAATPGVEVSTKMQSLTKGILSGEGFFVVKITGEGTVFLATYGSIETIDIAKGETVLVDNGHLVAWDADMKYKITKGAKTWFSAATSGEGFACRFEGPGRVLIQTRNPQELGGWLFPFLPIPRPSRA
jgi:uncharacterized protein (TIGR00266 family)